MFQYKLSRSDTHRRVQTRTDVLRRFVIKHEATSSKTNLIVVPLGALYSLLDGEILEPHKTATKMLRGCPYSCAEEATEAQKISQETQYKAIKRRLTTAPSVAVYIPITLLIGLVSYPDV